MNKVRNEERSFIAECVIDGAISMIWYQHRLVDAYRSAPEEARGLYLYSRAAAYDWEFGHYQHAEEHLELYMGQLCESDSRAYASCAVDAYFRHIEEYGRGDESGADPDAES